MDRSTLSLKWLEVFQAVARAGSVREAATELKVATSTVSHHLACLETAVGITLIDHHKRPMALTPGGLILLRRVDEALLSLRKGVSEILSEDLSVLLRELRIAAIEDFDTDVAPALVEHLSRRLKSCEFTFLSRPSHQIFALLQSEEVDIGFASNSEFKATDLVETPLLRDPYVLLVPHTSDLPPADYLSGETDLPFLRYSKNQLIGRQVEAQLRRIGRTIPSRMEFESNLTIFSIVAAGRGWTITTALSYARARRFHDRLRLLPFPAKAFARQISMFSAADMPQPLRDLIQSAMGPFVEKLAVQPTVAKYGWLADSLRVLTPENPEAAVPGDLSE